MSLRRLSVVACGLLIVAASGAEAHYLFVRITPMAEGGRAAEVYFSDRAEAGDPGFVAKIARTRLWVQEKPGAFRPIEPRAMKDRLRAMVPASGSVSVVGACEYGVLSRPNAPAFLLRHYPKAIDGDASELNAMKPIGKDVPLEIVATVTDGGLRFVGLRDGRPVPKAEFITVAPDLANETIRAGEDGVGVWKPSKPGVYSITLESKLKQAGSLDGTPYEEIREFATLAFAWPMGPSREDPEAIALFGKAIADRAQWRDFPGFSAEVAVDFDGRSSSGKVDVSPEGKVKASIDDAVARKWIEDQIGSIVLHRLADSGAEAAPSLRFADDKASHPLGRLLAFNGGRFASSYRIKDGRIATVNRAMGKSNVTITTLGEERNVEGKSLPTSYVVQSWNASTGDLERSDTFQERWLRVGNLDLPKSRVVTSASAGGLSVRGFSLDKFLAVAPAKP